MNNKTVKSTIIDWDYKYYVVDTINRKFIYGFSNRKEADSYKGVCVRNGITAGVLVAADITSNSFGSPSDLSNWSEYFPKAKGLTD